MTSNTLKPGDAFVYMKVGVHANESLEDIIERKRREIQEAGVSFWGYGGVCHPLTTVQPFIKEVSANGTTVRLLMQKITSRHYAVGEATEYTEDGRIYKPIPKGVKVLGSRFALVLRSLDEVELDVALSSTTVGIGNKVGSSGAQYIRGHVDKACLIYTPENAQAPETPSIRMSLAGELVAPYAVILR